MTLKFLKSALLESDWIHDNRKEVAFIGRSNVGKSSLINALFNSNIVKTSSTPGRTQMINFFDTDKNFRIIDLPGYGYSKIKLDDVIKINKNINQYLNERVNLKLIVLVLDINVITNKDQIMIDELIKLNKPFIIALNKTDKLNKSYFDNNKHKIAQYLDVDETYLIPVSAKNKNNLNKIVTFLNNLKD